MTLILRPVTIWITGLSASGKTTLGQRLFEGLLKQDIKNVDFFDGEDVRRKLGEVYGYFSKDRDKLNFYKARLALNSNKAGNIAIVTSVSHKLDVRKKIRNYISNFMEVYLKCPANICAQRDYKGHYEKAAAGKLDNFVGVTEPYQESKDLELVLDTSAESIEQCFKALLEASLDYIFQRVKEEVFE